MRVDGLMPYSQISRLAPALSAAAWHTAHFADTRAWLERSDSRTTGLSNADVLSNLLLKRQGTSSRVTRSSISPPRWRPGPVIQALADLQKRG